MLPQLAYEVYGSGPPLILGTSYLWGAAMWEPQIRALSAERTVIVPLLPGHDNDIPLPVEVTTPAALARWVGSLLDTLGVRQVPLVGLSVGGMWAAELALQRPQQISSLLLMDTFLGSEPDATQSRYFAMLDAIEAQQQIPAALIEQIVPLFFHPDMDSTAPLPRQFAGRLATWPASRIPALVALGRLIFGRPDRLDALAGLDPQRTAVAVGEGDTPRPPHEAEQMAAIIGCACHIIEGAGHIAALEQPEAVTALIKQHLRMHEQQ